MVAPSDIGRLAAQLLTVPLENTGLHNIDVARAFSTALNKTVKAVKVPSENWKQTLTGMGFSDKAAVAMANMTAITLNEKYEISCVLHKGKTSLEAYISEQVNIKAFLRSL
ncbi:hypothetical protein [Dyadobacter sp. NIV53]|uniref:hypothetical protein n=1 Tax=Dyadobacter sp. NIV53 TaxID=2861765 RepID=UPI001C879D4A|nr:hypothetical protein [Dyadobacter sp. NIV53]